MCGRMCLWLCRLAAMTQHYVSLGFSGHLLPGGFLLSDRFRENLTWNIEQSVQLDGRGESHKPRGRRGRKGCGDE